MTYATVEDLHAYTADLPDVEVPEDPEAAARVLERAERDLDRVIGGIGANTNGLRVDPATLAPSQQAALARGTCAQAAHRLILGDSYFSEPEDILTGDLTIIRPAQRVATRAVEEIAGHGIIRRSGCA